MFQYFEFTLIERLGFILFVKKLKLILWSIISVLVVIIVTTPTAYAASCKLPKSYYKNVSCTSSSGYYLAVKDFGAPVALIDNNGKRVIDLTMYQRVDANKIAGGLMPVQRNSHVGYINMQGREVVPTLYDLLSESAGWARAVADGRIVVKRGGQYGVISTSNQTIVPFSKGMSQIDNYRNGVARAQKSNVVSWLDKNGNVTNDPNASPEVIVNNQANKQATTNESQPSSEPKNNAAIMPFTTLQPQQQNGKWGFVDDRDVVMITYSFDEVKPFSEGLAAVRIDNKWGFLSLGGKLVIPFRFDKNEVSAASQNSDSVYSSPLLFIQGKAWIGNQKDGTKMCIDKSGTSISCE